ncbi:tripartite motif-containing protein 16-like [Gadus macrocephalus]|uniref:tripartite motif-containing protein 16-like n=1 Tax=Gadus macrocephalus TaxID=80720 RepID=UPI0028CB2970|nr:tripartite motif-containing protein 16-like [Gadus macrocephalus]
MASANTSLSEENFSCPICLDVFSNPVSTPCGHNFCRTCINMSWDEQVQCKCPFCNELFNTRPHLRVNILLSELTAQIKKSVRVKEQPFVESAEVPCDVCTGTQLAVKFCLVCLTSYCQTHLEPHHRVTGLKKHQLVEPMDRMCKKHDRPLGLFCKTEQVCVCQSCTETDHKFHPVVPLKEVYEVKMAQLGKIEAEVQQMIQNRIRMIQGIKDTVEFSKKEANRAKADGVQVLTALKRRIAKCQEDFYRAVEEKLNSTEKQAEDLIKELEQEIKDLTNRSSEVKQLSHNKDHLHFLQAFRSLKNPPSSRDWMTVEVRPPSYGGTLRRSMDQLEETLNMEMKKVPDLKPGIKKYACELTLDPNTAHRKLSLSEDNREVTLLRCNQGYPGHLERFDYCRQVLCREGLTGRCYWEVEWEERVDIGVTYRGITRRGRGDDSMLGENNMSWCLHCDDNNGDDFFSAHFNGRQTGIPVPSCSNTIGVYLDQPAGILSFYEVSPDVGRTSDTLTHIHTFQHTFTQDLYPGFMLYDYGTTVTLCRL